MLQTFNHSSASVSYERLILALGVLVASFAGIAALFTPYPFLAPALTVLFVAGLFVIRFPELAVYGVLVGIFFTGGNNPLSPLMIHGMIKLGAPLLMIWAIARAITTKERNLAAHQKIALGFGIAFCIYSATSWILTTDAIATASFLIVQRQFISCCLFVSIILLQDRLRLELLLLAVATGAVLSALLSIPLDTAHIENGRDAGFLGDPNLYSAYLVAVIPLAAAFYFRSKDLLVKLVALALLGLVALTVLKSGSRAGLVACAFSLMATFIISFKSQLIQWKHTSGIAAVAVIGAALFVLPQASKIFDRSESIGVVTSIGEFDRSTARRISYISVGIDEIKNAPILGNGTGSFPKAFANSNFSKMFMTSKEVFPLYRRAHNSYLEVLAELGIVGFLLFGGALATAFLSAVTTARQQGSNAPLYLPPLSIFPAISLAALGLMMITLSIQEMYMVWIIMAICIITKKQDAPHE